MMGDLPGPTFWHLDGSSMDNDFAFDLYSRTREDWEAEQRSWDEYSQRCDADRSERERLGVTDAESAGDVSSSDWSGSFSTADVSELPLVVRVFSIGARLADLIERLRSADEGDSTRSEAQPHIDQLNRDFGNLREILQGDDSSLADALIEPVLRRFGQTLESVAAVRPGVASQCERGHARTRRALGAAERGRGP